MNPQSRQSPKADPDAPPVSALRKLICILSLALAAWGLIATLAAAIAAPAFAAPLALVAGVLGGFGIAILKVKGFSSRPDPAGERWPG